MRAAVRFSAFGLLILALGSCSLFDYSGIVVHKYALVYGVTRYSMTPAPGTGPNLTYPAADASSVAGLLAAQGYTVKSRWVAYNGELFVDGVDQLATIGSPATTTTDGSIITGQGALDAVAPTKPRIIADIQAMGPVLGPNDILVVYFSGHGTQDTNPTPPREYFDPYQGVLAYGGQFYDFPVPSVRDDDLKAAFDALPTPRKVLVLDTCNSGGFIGNQLEADWTPPAIAGQLAWVNPATLITAIANYAAMQSSPTGLSPYGAQVLSAAGRDELSYETSSYAHGVMTYWLLQGLGGPADLNHDGHITVLEAFAYAKAGVDQNWNPAVGAASAFEPHVSGGPVDFVLF